MQEPIFPTQSFTDLTGNRWGTSGIPINANSSDQWTQSQGTNQSDVGHMPWMPELAYWSWWRKWTVKKTTSTGFCVMWQAAEERAIKIYYTQTPHPVTKICHTLVAEKEEKQKEGNLSLNDRWSHLKNYTYWLQLDQVCSPKKTTMSTISNSFLFSKTFTNAIKCRKA